MAALTPTLVATYDASSGNKKMKIFSVAIGSASDTVALSSYFSSIDLVLYNLSAGVDAALQDVQVAHSATTVTLTSFNAAGAAATDWTSVAGKLIVFGEDEGL